MSWDLLEVIIEPFYPKPGNGRIPYQLSTMLHSLHATLLQHE